MIQIDKGVPLPPTHNTMRGYPFASMEVGDSFAVTHDKERSIRTIAARTGEKFGWRFAVRKFDHEVRVWRVS